MKTKKKQPQVSVEEYIQTYCQERRMRNRIALYVSRETHKKLKKVTAMFRYEHYTTTASLADAIVTRHIEAHKELLNDAYRRFIEEDRREVAEHYASVSDNGDSESCPDDDSEE